MPRCGSGKLSRYGDLSGRRRRDGLNRPVNRLGRSRRCGMAMRRVRIGDDAAAQKARSGQVRQSRPLSAVADA